MKSSLYKMVKVKLRVKMASAINLTIYLNGEDWLVLNR